MITKAKVMQSLLTLAVLAVATRIPPVKEVVLNEKKFLGIF